MSTHFAKRSLVFLTLFALIALACDMTVSLSPSTATNPAPLPTETGVPATLTPIQTLLPPTSIPATLGPNVVDTLVPREQDGVEVAVDPLRLVLPPHLASGVRGQQIPHAEGDNVAPWDVDPGHVQIKLEGYPLQDRMHEPQIDVYPAQAYAEMYPAAFETIHRLDNILYPPGGPALNDQLPFVPFFNAAQVFTSNAQLISFQGGQGVRFLTEYAQYPASVNNHDLFYEFEGVTRDGMYYIVAILPVTAPMLAETSDAGAALPTGGVPYPYFADPEADMEAYYAAIVNLLTTSSSDAFSPTLTQLDALIQSMRIMP